MAPVKKRGARVPLEPWEKVQGPRVERRILTQEALWTAIHSGNRAGVERLAKSLGVRFPKDLNNLSLVSVVWIRMG